MTCSSTRNAIRRLRLPLLLVLMALVSGCATRPDLLTLETVAADHAPGVRTVGIYAVTTRTREKPGSNLFDSGRALKTNYAQFTVSIPPGHQPAKVEWPTRTPDPATTFAVVSQDVLDGAQFRKDVAGAGGPNGQISVFVHGYNYSFQEALFRLAQMTADSGITGMPILFSWPSQATVEGYLADRESATYSRDALVALLVELARDRPRGDILLFGHSMGGWLVMEALRQLKLAGRADVLSRLEVVLAAPDIDADVMRQELEVIGRLSPPMTILVSKDDRALKVASFISGSSVRVGALDVNDPRVREAAVKHGVLIVDISELPASDTLNHDKFFGLAALYRSVAARSRIPTLGQVGAVILDTAGATVSSPFKIMSGVLDPVNGAPSP